MGAVFTPIGGGRIGKAEAFDVLASALNIDERPIAAVQADLFRLVFQVGGYALGELDRSATGRPPLVLWAESWQLLGCLYEGLSGLEADAMRSTYAANLEQLITERKAEVDEEDEQQTNLALTNAANRVGAVVQATAAQQPNEGGDQL